MITFPTGYPPPANSMLVAETPIPRRSQYRGRRLESFQDKADPVRCDCFRI